MTLSVRFDIGFLGLLPRHGNPNSPPRAPVNFIEGVSKTLLVWEIFIEFNIMCYDPFETNPELRKEYTAIRQLPDGRWCGVHRLMYHWTLHIDIGDFGYEDRYCYNTEAQAYLAMMEWNGEGDPGHGWHRHPLTGRRRDDGKEESEYVAW